MMQEFSPIGRRSLLGLATAAFVVEISRSPASAETPNDTGSTGPIQRLNAALLATMKAGRSTSFEQRFTSLAPVVEQTFDLDAVLAASIGLGWPALPNDQKAQLRAAFRRYTVASYVASFDNFTGQTFQVSPTVREVGNGDVVVQSKIVSPDGSVTPLDYVMRDGQSGWRAVDVLAGGSISRVAVQRSDFRSVLQSGGVPALMAALQHKVANLQAA
jgi:phospholipid transport system substrate-binding protein